jgi:hypothetical protein
MKTIITIVLFIILSVSYNNKNILVNSISENRTTDVPAKENLKVYTKDDGIGGNSYINYHAFNKSNKYNITFTGLFSTDGQYPTNWNQSFTIKKNEDRIICPARYQGSTNSVFYKLVEAHYTN